MDPRRCAQRRRLHSSSTLYLCCCSRHCYNFNSFLVYDLRCLLRSALLLRSREIPLFPPMSMAFTAKGRATYWEGERARGSETERDVHTRHTSETLLLFLFLCCCCCCCCCCCQMSRTLSLCCVSKSNFSEGTAKLLPDRK